MMMGRVRRGMIKIEIIIEEVEEKDLRIMKVDVEFLEEEVEMMVLKVIKINEVYEEIEGKIMVMMEEIIKV